MKSIYRADLLAGKIAIVTGGAHGIGRGIVTALATAKCHVFIADLNEELGPAFATDLKSMGLLADFVKTDLRLEGDIRNLVSRASTISGKIDLIVNNARPRLERSTPDDLLNSWDVALQVLLKAPAQLVDAALPALRKATGASVINISSTNAHVIAPQPLAYHVAKAGIGHMTRFLAHHLGPMGIRVNTLTPGLVDIHDDNRPLTSNEVHREITELVVPLQRAAVVEDVANAVLFLASDASSYIQGQEIFLDGGITTGDQFHVAKSAFLKGSGK